MQKTAVLAALTVMITSCTVPAEAGPAESEQATPLGCSSGAAPCTNAAIPVGGRQRFVPAIAGATVVAGAPRPNGIDGMRMSSISDQFFLGFELEGGERLGLIRAKVRPETGAVVSVSVSCYDPDDFGGFGRVQALGTAATTTTDGRNENLDLTPTSQPSAVGARFCAALFRLTRYAGVDAFVGGLEIYDAP